jgi:FAD/FMN-containing dehydrogenase
MINIGAWGEQVAREIGTDAVCHDPQQLARYAWDGLQPMRAYTIADERRTAPQVLLQPATVADAQTIVRMAADAGVPLIPYGGGSGLMGGAIPLGPAATISLRRLNTVLDIDPQGMSVTVQAGAVLRDVQAQLAPHGLRLGHDPWTTPIATIGGTIATNGVGYNRSLYGAMGEQVLGLQVVLPNGDLFASRPARTASTGPDLTRLFIGAEGTLGLITAATLRAFPLPQARRARAYGLPTFAAGVAALQRIFATDLLPAMVELEEYFPGLGVEVLAPDSAGEYTVTLYLVYEGSRAFVRVAEQAGRALALEHGGVALPNREANRYVRERHQAAEYFQRARESGLSASRFLPDTTAEWVSMAIPARQVLAFRERVLPLAQAHGVQVVEMDLWTAPDLLAMMLALAGRDDAARRRMREAADAVARLAHEFGGAMEYVHGIGVRWGHLMGEELGAGLDMLRAIKRVLDPHNIMNPGKLGLP